MSNIKPFIGYEEQSDISKEIDRLFILQDKSINREKKQVILDELLKHRFTAQEIINGLRSLVDQDVATLKFATIIAAINDKAGNGAPKTETRCEYCNKSGAVVLEGDNNTTGAFQCTCDNGPAKNRILAKWSGQRYTTHNGVNYKYPWYDLYKKESNNG